MAQVSIPDRSAFSMFGRFGIIGSNQEFSALLQDRSDFEHSWKVKPYYASAPEFGMNFDLVRFKAATIGFQVSGMYAQQELLASDSSGSFRVGIPELALARASFTVSFNGNDPYTMFALPYHSNSEMVIGASGSVMQALDAKPTERAKDSLGITKIKGGTLVKTVGFFLGFNWRLGESGWVMGLCGSMLWTFDKTALIRIETGADAPYSGGTLLYDPRMAHFSLTYHF